MRRFTWPEMVEYWQVHQRRFGGLDYDVDPDGLANVCGPGQPAWLSRYLAASQRVVYAELLAAVPPAAPGSTALDVGTGAARWARVLADAGFETTGIDLQGTLIADNRGRFPDIDFHEVALQDYEPEQQFALVSSVTVLQHLPFEEQIACIGRLRRMTREGGHAILLEHVAGQAPHIFSRGEEEWRRLFGEAGFECLATIRYNYSPALRAYATLRSSVKRRRVERTVDARLRPEHLVARHTEAVSGPRRLLRIGDRAAMRIAVAADGILEPRLMRAQPRRLARDCGFLFRVP